MEDLVNSYNSWKLELPENYSSLSQSKKRKWKSQYNPKWKKDYPWIEEARIDREVIKAFLSRYIVLKQILKAMMEFNREEEIMVNL